LKTLSKPRARKSAAPPKWNLRLYVADNGSKAIAALRNLTVLCDAGVTRRVPGTDDLGRFELAEDLAGHHHHVLCANCGSLVDFAASARLERALAEASRQVAEQTGYEITGHRLDFDGRCPDCI